MYRASARQAALDARTAHRRRVQRLLLGAPDPYTSLGERPGRAMLAGAGVGVLIAVVLSVVTMAGVARQAAKEKEQAAARPVAAPASVQRPGPSRGQDRDGVAAAGAGAGTGTVTGEVTRDDAGAVAGQGSDPVVVAVVVRDGTGACRREASDMDVRPRFTGGVLRSVQVSGLGTACAGRTGTIRVLGPGSAQLAVRTFEAVPGAGERVTGWDGLRRDQIDRIVVAV